MIGNRPWKEFYPDLVEVVFAQKRIEDMLSNLKDSFYICCNWRNSVSGVEIINQTLS